MSGPKVVRIVTREELIASCQTQLRRLDGAIAEWSGVCERSGADGAQAISAMEQRRSELQRMLAEDQFAPLQKQIQVEMSFLQSDGQARLEAAAAAAERALVQRRRTANASRMLLKELERSGRAIPDDLRRALQSPPSQEQAVARALALLAPAQGGTGQTQRQRELAAKLADGERQLTLAEWLAEHPARADNPADLKIDRQLAELTALGADTVAFCRKAAEIVESPSERQALLLDSLLVELAQAVKEARARAAQSSALRQWALELSGHDTQPAQALRGRIEAALGAGELSLATTLVAEAQALAQEWQRAVAAAARRRAVLEGLARLGYEVSEGMATAWVQGGQVVLRKASAPGYGVELAGGSKSERVQVRVVAFGSAGTPRDAARDADMETLWCSEFERLRSSVATAGGAIEIEQALPPGAAALKVIEDGGARETADDSAPVTRTLKR
jgi:hypothetical protein